jgi:thymidylate synthase
MYVIHTRNVHAAIPDAVRLLRERGVLRESRNGKVITVPYPVTTVYDRPQERVIFWAQRDANPAFHLYESLWMLAGKNNIAPLVKYTKQIAEYSDDGETLHDAYGYRWRQHFHDVDQLEAIIIRLSTNSNDRRCVLQMWDPYTDLDYNGKAVPCNLTATFQIGLDGRLNMVVFCRSNDVIWGCYGANAVHFSILLEYMAARIGVPIGTYTQVSVNWHAYLKTLPLIENIQPELFNPYASRNIDITTHQDAYSRFTPGKCVRSVPIDIEDWRILLSRFIFDEENEFADGILDVSEWWRVVYTVLNAHAVWHTNPYPERTHLALMELNLYKNLQDVDWVVAAREWIQRRHDRWASKTNQDQENA